VCLFVCYWLPQWFISGVNNLTQFYVTFCLYTSLRALKILWEGGGKLGVKCESILSNSGNFLWRINFLFHKTEMCQNCKFCRRSELHKFQIKSLPNSDAPRNVCAEVFRKHEFAFLAQRACGDRTFLGYAHTWCIPLLLTYLRNIHLHLFDMHLAKKESQFCGNSNPPRILFLSLFLFTAHVSVISKWSVMFESYVFFVQ
jgi:hypothetical protein